MKITLHRYNRTRDEPSSYRQPAKEPAAPLYQTFTNHQQDITNTFALLLLFHQAVPLAHARISIVVYHVIQISYWYTTPDI